MGILSSLIFLLTPGVFILAAQTYVDLGTVFYTFMAVYSFIIWLEKKEGKWAALSGVMCGFTMSVKYFGVIVPFILGIYFIFAIFLKKDINRFFLRGEEP